MVDRSIAVPDLCTAVRDRTCDGFADDLFMVKLSVDIDLALFYDLFAVASV